MIATCLISAGDSWLTQAGIFPYYSNKKNLGRNSKIISDQSSYYQQEKKTAI